MNDTTQQEPGKAVAVRPPLSAGGQLAAIMPQSLEETFRLATAMHASNLVPASLNTVEKVLVAIMAGAELGLPPFQAVQSFAVINGRPTIWGDGMLAVVRSRGFTVKEWLEGEGEAMVAHCETVRPDTGEVIERSYSVEDAKTAQLWMKRTRKQDGTLVDTPWVTTPKRMLQMRARAFSLRDAGADVLRGFQMREEVDDYVEVREHKPTTTGLRERLEANKGEAAEGFTVDGERHHETPEEIIAEVEPIGGEVGSHISGDPVDDVQQEEVKGAEARPTETAGAQTVESEPDTSASATPASGATPEETSGPQPPAEASPSGEGTKADPGIFPGDLPRGKTLAEAEGDAAYERGRQEAVELFQEVDDPIDVYEASLERLHTWKDIKAAMITFRKTDTYAGLNADQRLASNRVTVLAALEAIKASGETASPRSDPTFYSLWLDIAEPAEVNDVFTALSMSPAFERLSDANKAQLARMTQNAIDVVAQ